MIIEDFYTKACESFLFSGWRIVNYTIDLSDTDGSVTEQQIKDKAAELFKDWEALAYSRNRAAAYDSVGNQLDMLMKDMKNNTTTHQESCEAVKAKYPKP